jgi:hypothetical protein
MKNSLFQYYLLWAIVGSFLGCLSIPTMAQEDPCTVAGYVLSSNANNVTCPGAANGVATVASTGCQCMFSGCTFLWDNGQTTHTATNLAAGSYNVTVTHPNGCILNTSVVVAEPEPFIEEVSIENVTCASSTNGQLSVVPTLSAGLLDFAWNTGDSTATISNLVVGAYTVTVTNALGCTNTRSMEILAPTPPALQMAASPTCAGMATGSAGVTVQGGTAPFAYQWNDPNNCVVAVAPNLAAGNYLVTITDANNCTFVSNPITVGSTTPNVVATSAASQVCPGATVQLNAAGGVSYVWNNTTSLSNASISNPLATIQSPTTYIVTVTTAQGCTATANVTISTKTPPTPTATPANTTICGGNHVQLMASNNGSAATYAWSPSTGLNNANINAPVATPTNSTTYTVVATASNGCTASTQVTVEVIACAVGMDDIAATDFVSLYPNPATDGVTIWVEAPTSTTATLQLFDVTGKLVFQNKINTNTTQYIAVDQLPKGVYYAQILTTDKQYRQELVVW